MEPILVCRNFCNKYLIMTINHTNRMNFGTHEWQKRVRVNYFKDLDQRRSCNEQWLRTIQAAPPVKALVEMTQHREDRGRIRILFSMATFNSFRYEAILLSAKIVWYFFYDHFFVHWKCFWPQLFPSSWVALTAPLGNHQTMFYILLRASWVSLFSIYSLLDPFINWTSSSVSSWSL